jgi:DNA-binding NarL/FixJ family response regulator
MSKKIVICDDHTLFLNGLTEILKKFGNNYSVIVFNDTDSCKLYIQNNYIDVFICDLNIDNKDGFDLIEDLKTELTNTKTIILSAYYENFLIRKAEKLGINAFLRKETDYKELIEVIEFDKSINKFFYTNNSSKNSFIEPIYKDNSIINKFRLSKQEKQIIILIIEGKTSKEIADLLFITKNTVDTHRKNINRKLETSNSTTLIKFAHENNLFS